MCRAFELRDLGGIVVARQGAIFARVLEYADTARPYAASFAHQLLLLLLRRSVPRDPIEGYRRGTVRLRPALSRPRLSLVLSARRVRGTARGSRAFELSSAGPAAA